MYMYTHDEIYTSSPRTSDRPRTRAPRPWPLGRRSLVAMAVISIVVVMIFIIRRRLLVVMAMMIIVAILFIIITTILNNIHIILVLMIMMITMIAISPTATSPRRAPTARATPSATRSRRT